MAPSAEHHDEHAADVLAAPEPPAPIAIIDFLANADATIRRLGTETPTRDWVLVRRLGDEWVVLSTHGDHGMVPGDPLHRPPGASDHLDQHAARWEREVLVDLRAGEIRPDPDAFGARGLEESGTGLVAFPIWSADGLFGAVCALPGGPGEEAALRRSAPLVRLAVGLLSSLLVLDLDRSRLQRRVDAAESAALNDPLTSLGNRRAFDRALDREEARCARFGHRAGVIVLDLDRLKQVNDTLGHEAGDRMLQQAASTLRTSLRGADQAFRTGGDEFALLLPEVADDSVDGVCERLHDALARAGVSASIGCAIRQPGGDLRTAAREADAAMYRRKRARATRAPRTPGRSTA